MTRAALKGSQGALSGIPMGGAPRVPPAARSWSTRRGACHAAEQGVPLKIRCAHGQRSGLPGLFGSWLKSSAPLNQHSDVYSGSLFSISMPAFR